MAFIVRVNATHFAKPDWKENMTSHNLLLNALDDLKQELHTQIWLMDSMPYSVNGWVVRLALERNAKILWTSREERCSSSFKAETNKRDHFALQSADELREWLQPKKDCPCLNLHIGKLDEDFECWWFRYHSWGKEEEFVLQVPKREELRKIRGSELEARKIGLACRKRKTGKGKPMRL